MGSMREAAFAAFVAAATINSTSPVTHSETSLLATQNERTPGFSGEVPGEAGPGTATDLPAPKDAVRA